jgi:hypothetical protein
LQDYRIIGLQDYRIVGFRRILRKHSAPVLSTKKQAKKQEKNQKIKKKEYFAGICIDCKIAKLLLINTLD